MANKKVKPLTQKEENRYDELYQDAVARYLDKTDFDPTDYLDTEEAEEFVKLQERLFG